MSSEKKASPEATCKYCSGKSVTTCQICGSPICKSHFITCPFCRARLCHPDVGDCYFEHKC